MRARGNFTPMNPGESEVFGLDFALDLPAGDAMGTGTPVVTLLVLTGVDPDSEGRLDGDPEVSGTVVSQRVTNPVACVYGLQINIVTHLGNDLILWAPIACVAVGKPVPVLP